jgi:two-component system sensor histidine kinase AlgZ
MDARIAALQARIRPHFLFNSMNIIASLIPVDPDGAERAVEDLSALFRASLREGATTVPLADEIELCERYLRLEQLRLGERLSIERSIGVLPAALRIPPLSVQPLLENAVYHGVQPRPEGGCVRLAVSCEPRMLRIEVSNPLPGEAARESNGAGMALANIRDRLAAIYGDRASLETARVDGSFVARLAIPREGGA